MERFAFCMVSFEETDSFDSAIWISSDILFSFVYLDKTRDIWSRDLVKLPAHMDIPRLGARMSVVQVRLLTSFLARLINCKSSVKEKMQRLPACYWCGKAFFVKAKPCSLHAFSDF